MALSQEFMTNDLPPHVQAGPQFLELRSFEFESSFEELGACGPRYLLMSLPRNQSFYCMP